MSMYRPLEPHVREFALATLAALLRFDLRVIQINKVIRLEADNLMRSDVVVLGLIDCLGATLDSSKAKALEAYSNLVLEMNQLLPIPGVGHPPGNRKPEFLAALDKLLQDPAKLLTTKAYEAAVATILATKMLNVLEDLVHTETKGTISQRSKRRLMDRLETAKKRIGDQAQAAQAEAQGVALPPVNQLEAEFLAVQGNAAAPHLQFNDDGWHAGVADPLPVRHVVDAVTEEQEDQPPGN